MQRGDIIKYNQVVSCEEQNLQKGMNFNVGHKNYSVVLMSVRPGAPYNDRFEDNGSTIIYEGHDMPNYRHLTMDPKMIDQPRSIGGVVTENGKFFSAAAAYQNGEANYRLVRVYEKIKSGIWAYNGFFKLADAWEEIDKANDRKVCKFKLEMIDDEGYEASSERDNIEVEHNRLIPTEVKVKVWARDKGCCVICGAKENLHFDHDIPYSKGGSSKTVENIRILCAKCNLRKSDKIV